ncbi:MAG: transferase [Paludibacteraceae bacterium]|nr:transferase [Paludibacteraceae bacterium]
MSKQIYLLGVGGSTPIYVDIALDCGYEIAGLYHYNDERTGQMDHGYPILGSFEDLLNSDIGGQNFMLTMGNNEIREKIFERLINKEGNVPTIFHPTAIVSRYATISDCGVIVGPYTEIQADTNISCNTIIGTNAVVGHGTTIMSNCFIGPKALVGASTKLEDNVFVGQASTIVSGKVDVIGKYSLVGAGGIVTKSVPTNVIVAGNPVKVIRRRFEKYIIEE